MKTRKLNRKTLFLFALPFVPLAALLLRKPEPKCANRVEVSIGNFPSRAAGQRASLKQLAQELKRCPHAQKFSILRNNIGLRAWVDENYELTFYDRKTGFLQDGVPIYGANTQWLKVNDQAVFQVAATTGRFNDFAKCGAVYSMP